MEINVDKKRLKDPGIIDLVNYLESNEEKLDLASAQLYYDFPILKDVDDTIVIAQVLLISPNHGVIAIATSDSTTYTHFKDEIAEIETKLDNVFSLLYSRLIRNRNLRKSKTELFFSTNTFIFAPLLDKKSDAGLIETTIISNNRHIEEYLTQVKTNTLNPEIYSELLSTVEGAKGLVRSKARETSHLKPVSKGALANKIESEITRFDMRQKHGAMTVLDGLQRIRGLAGSGKTVVLAMKAALTHLRNPDATIIYTFYTRFLYQHIQRLITRFYRQFDDKDPDWSKLKIIHGWGGHTKEGVYFNACVAHNVEPVTLREANRVSNDPFGYACSKLLKSTEIAPLYDYIFVDEGQDFPASFIELCTKLAKNNRVVFAYDDLQTIFQPTAPSIKNIVGVDENGKSRIELNEDVILDKCYRNPREILVCAHALGFGIYGRIVQMLENKEQWEDIGYKVNKPKFIEGEFTEIERPAKNSLTTISENQQPNEIIQAFAYTSFPEEIEKTVEGIKSDLLDGLRPEDILVITVDDRHARSYLEKIAELLALSDIPSNNVHEDSYGIRDFQKDGLVTLSTVHKAKGNEAFMVYVVGVDALYTSYAGPRERNVLFTAMTRAKGWVRISGIGSSAADWKAEIEKALQEFPYLRFEYPSQEQIKIIKRDLAEKAVRKYRAERKLDEILEDMTTEEIEKFLKQRSIKKKK